MKRRSATPWVVFKLPEGCGVIYCDRCGDSYNLRPMLPCLIDVYLGACEGFERAHSGCRPKKKEV